METLYRKYRPKDFEEVVGQVPIKRLFQRSIEAGALSHAYIFTGPKGTGKTTFARIISKRVNCLAPLGSNPCNRCDQCLAIANGNHLDVIEMDAASNRGIDDFRAIREKIAYQPVQGRKKVYIIDEVHMLTNEAFNACLLYTSYAADDLRCVDLGCRRIIKKKTNKNNNLLMQIYHPTP